jgi:hypothetical protein
MPHFFATIAQNLHGAPLKRKGKKQFYLLEATGITFSYMLNLDGVADSTIGSISCK